MTRPTLSYLKGILYFNSGNLSCLQATRHRKTASNTLIFVVDGLRGKGGRIKVNQWTDEGEVVDGLWCTAP